MTDAVKIEPAKVKSFVDRVENLEKEKQAIGNDVREVYDEAKKAGLNTKALRKVVAKRRAKTPDPQVVAAMHAYELALDEAAAMVSNGDTSLREATAQTGFSKSAIQRRLSQRNQNAASGTMDPETGEITEADTLRSQIPASTDPARLEREARHAEETEHSEIPRGAMPSKDGAKVVRTEPSMSGSVAASGDAVRDASAMPLDVVAAPHSEGREHGGSASSAPPACDPDDDWDSITQAGSQFQAAINERRSA